MTFSIILTTKDIHPSRLPGILSATSKQFLALKRQPLAQCTLVQLVDKVQLHIKIGEGVVQTVTKEFDIISWTIEMIVISK